MQNNNDRAHPEDSAQPSANPERPTILGIVEVAYPEGKHKFPALVFGAWAVHPGVDDGRWRVTHAPSGRRVRVPEPRGDSHGDVEWFEAIAVAEELRRVFGAFVIGQGDSSNADRASDAIWRAIGRATTFILSTDWLK